MNRFARSARRLTLMLMALVLSGGALSSAQAQSDQAWRERREERRAQHDERRARQDDQRAQQDERRARGHQREEALRQREQAQQLRQERRQERREQLRDANANRDGAFSRDEVERRFPRFSRRFGEIDSNADGQVTREELRAFRARSRVWQGEGDDPRD